jgi:hypothetical protein
LTEEDEENIKMLYMKSSFYVWDPASKVDNFETESFYDFKTQYCIIFKSRKGLLEQNLFDDCKWTLFRLMIHKGMEVKDYLNSENFKNASFGDRFDRVEVGFEIYIEIYAKDTKLWKEMCEKNQNLGNLQTWIDRLNKLISRMTKEENVFEDHSIDSDQLNECIESLNAVEGASKWNFLREYVTYISFEEFQKNMRACVELFITALKGSVFSVYLVKGEATRKSCIWLTVMFILSDDRLREKITSQTDETCENRVVIDDAGYTGNQMKRFIRGRQFIGHGRKHVIVPYITHECMLQWVEGDDDTNKWDASEPHKVEDDNVSLYFFEVFDPIQNRINLIESKHEPLRFCENKYMFYFQHGAADDWSICHKIFNYENFKFVKNCKNSIPSCIKKVYHSVIPTV